jgi:hypothetical protein
MFHGATSDLAQTVTIVPIIAVPYVAAGTRARVDMPVAQRYVLSRLSAMRDAAFAALDVYADLSGFVRAWTVGAGLLDETMPTPSVVPSEDGGVTFVWHKGGWDVEVEIDPTETTVWAYSRHTGETWFGELDTHRQALRQLLREMNAE